MVVLSKRNIIIPAPDGKTKKFIAKDYIGEVEKWVTETNYFKALVKDGKIVVTSTADKELDKAAEKPVTDHTRRKKTEE